MRKFIVGIIIGIALAFSASVSAENLNEFILTKTEYPTVVKGIEYNNPDLPVLNYKGNTYVPLKSIGDMLGASVKWNDKSKRVEIGEANQISVSNRQTEGQKVGEMHTYIKHIVFVVNGIKYSWGYPNYGDNYYNGQSPIVNLNLISMLIALQNNKYSTSIYKNEHAGGISGEVDDTLPHQLPYFITSETIYDNLKDINSSYYQNFIVSNPQNTDMKLTITTKGTRLESRQAYFSDVSSPFTLDEVIQKLDLTILYNYDTNQNMLTIQTE